MRTPRFKAAPDSPVAYYHCVSRIVNRSFVLEEQEKLVFRRLMREYAAFCGVRVITFCLMANHFHILVEVSARPKEELSDEALLSRLRAIYSRPAVTLIRKSLEEMAADPERAAEYKDYREGFFRRMWDVSEFMKAVKQRFTQWFNHKHERKGTLWEERFRSVLVEGTPQALSVMAAYIDLNPVRAGIVKDPKDYHWSGYGEAMGGNRVAKEALRQVLPPGQQDLAGYRKLLYAHGAQEGISSENQRVRPGFSHEEAQAVWKAGGKLSTGQLVACKVRYFVDGAVLGSKEFVNEVFTRKREHFGPKRKDGARPIRGVESKELFTLRALRLRPIG